MFRALPVVHDIQRTDALTGAAAAYRRDTLTLGWDERLKARARRRTDGGVEFATALPRGTVLRRGDCFAIDAVSLVVAVVERLEPVFVLRPRTPRDCRRAQGGPTAPCSACCAAASAQRCEP